MVCIVAQLLTAGVALPVYFLAHIQSIPTVPTLLPRDALGRVRTLLPAIIVGYLVPSWFLVLPPKGVSLDTVQKISAAWQPFPLYIAAFWVVFRKLDSWRTGPLTGPASVDRREERSRVLGWLRRSYYACGVISAWAHLYVFVPSLTTTVSSHSFANIFIPFWMHPHLPISLAAGPLAAYRPCSRLLFQHDWLMMTVAAVTFFGRWHLVTQKGRSESTRLGGWAVRMLFVSLVGGPGAALAWAGIEREERIACGQDVKKDEYD